MLLIISDIALEETALRFLQWHLRLANVRKYSIIHILAGRSVLDSCGYAKDSGKYRFPIYHGRYLRREFDNKIEALAEKIREQQPTVIVALGGTVTALLSQAKKSIDQTRGYVTVSPFCRRDNGTLIKIIPTYSPMNVIRNFELRPIFFKDLEKANKETASPEIIKTPRQVWLHPTIESLKQFTNLHIIPYAHLPWGIDIETAGGTITEIGFARPSIGIVIPFLRRPDQSYWETADDELAAWLVVRDWLTIIKRPVFQNGLYDIQYLLGMGIHVSTIPDDTMLMAHSQQPEFRKSLSFLASIYTNTPAWKSIRRESFKTEDAE